MARPKTVMKALTFAICVLSVSQCATIPPAVPSSSINSSAVVDSTSSGEQTDGMSDSTRSTEPNHQLSRKEEALLDTVAASDIIADEESVVPLEPSIDDELLQRFGADGDVRDGGDPPGCSNRPTSTVTSTRTSTLTSTSTSTRTSTTTSTSTAITTVTNTQSVISTSMISSTTTLTSTSTVTSTSTSIGTIYNTLLVTSLFTSTVTDIDTTTVTSTSIELDTSIVLSTAVISSTATVTEIVQSTEAITSTATITDTVITTSPIYTTSVIQETSTETVTATTTATVVATLIVPTTTIVTQGTTVVADDQHYALCLNFGKIGSVFDAKLGKLAHKAEKDMSKILNMAGLGGTKSIDES